MVSLGLYDWLAIAAKDEPCPTPRDVDRRCGLQHAAASADGSERRTSEYSGEGKLMGLQRERKWIFGAARAILCFADVHSGPRHTPSGSPVQL